MPLYFAYGANMDVAAMATRCPRSKAICPARLMRHRLVVMREGWLNAARDPHSTVHGLLWELALADVTALDRFEGVASGLYRKALQAVATERGARRALVYFGANCGPGVAPASYLESVLAAARVLRLPDAALAALGALGANPSESAREAPPRVRPRYATPFDRP